MDNVKSDDFFSVPEIIKNLKRYSFSAKMNVTQLHFEKIMEMKKLDYLDKGLDPYPWELEMFTALSIIAEKEYDFNVFNNKQGKRKLRKIFNSLRISSAGIILASEDFTEAPAQTMRTLTTQQIAYQHEFILDFYRYTFLFNFQDEKTDIKRIFHEKFGCIYDRCIVFAYSILLINNCAKATDTPDSWRRGLETVYSEFEDVVNLFTITRSEILAKAKAIPDVLIEKAMCKLLLQYIFIDTEENRYIPLPHVVPYAVTHGLMYRLTEGDDDTRRLIGKTALEAYLYKILHDTNNYDDITQESEYSCKGTKALSPDVCIYKDHTLVFFEMKSIVPSIRSNSIHLADYEAKLKQIAKSVDQLCGQIYRFQEGLFNPSNKTKNHFSDSVFGIIVLQEESYFQNSEILPYLKECSKTLLGFRVFVTDLFNIERVVLFQQDLYKVIRYNSTAKQEEFVPWVQNFQNTHSQYSKEIMDFKDGVVDKTCHKFKTFSTR